MSETYNAEQLPDLPPGQEKRTITKAELEQMQLTISELQARNSILERALDYAAFRHSLDYGLESPHNMAQFYRQKWIEIATSSGKSKTV